MTRFEWDTAKAASNVQKHGISFELAARVFADPYAVSYPDGWSNTSSAGGRSAWCNGVASLSSPTPAAAKRATKSSESFRLVRPAGVKGNVMNSKIVRYDIDLQNLPPLTAAQEKELAALANLPDSAIDTGDIPPLTEEFWRNGVRGRFYKPTKTSTTVRIDSDVLAWLRASGKGYQSRLNAILRREMLQSLK